MTRAEIMATPIGEMLDMLDCHAIVNGAEPKAAKRSVDDILMNVR